MDKKILKLFKKWRDCDTSLTFDEYCCEQGRIEGKAEKGVKLVEINDTTVFPNVKWFINPKQICSVREIKTEIEDMKSINYKIVLTNGSRFLVTKEDFEKLTK